MPRRPLALLATALVVASSGCGREPAFADRTARVTFGDRTTTFQLDSCGLDGTTAFLVGRSDDGATLQAVVGVEGDGETGVPDATGLTVLGVDGVDVSAFGPEAWSRRGRPGDPPGAVDEARVRGARISASGTGVVVDRDEQPVGDQEATLSLDARCDAEGPG